jgi:hypothetical protein
VDRLTLAVGIVAVTLIGCGSGDSNPAPTENEKTAITESKAAWDPAKVEAFKKAHAEDGRQTPGQKATSKTSGEQASK